MLVVGHTLKVSKLINGFSAVSGAKKTYRATGSFLAVEALTAGTSVAGPLNSTQLVETDVCRDV